jgi:6-linalyl-2-O,3-dimethylflaviolin/7-geranyloxy-5-hydroxy-2-methoxy-3-methylnaphthalene-1,4-dione synthase
MSENASVTELRSVIGEAAALLGVTPDEENVRSVLTAYEDVLPAAVIAFRVATDARHDGELDFRFTVPKDLDPYAVARDRGLIAGTDHPVGRLLDDVQERLPVDSFGVDFGVVGGYAKNWVYFSEDRFPDVPALVDLPSMPPSLAKNADLLERNGLTGVVEVLAVNYDRRTVNVYFPNPVDRTLAATVRSLHREAGLPEPSAQMLALCDRSFGVYVTLNWDSPGLERVSIGVSTKDPLALPVRLDPRIVRFVEGFPHGAGLAKKVFVAMTSAGEEYLKLQSFYRWLPRERGVRRQLA